MQITLQQATKYLAAHNRKYGAEPVHWCGNDTIEDLRAVCHMADPMIWQEMLAYFNATDTVQKG